MVSSSIIGDSITDVFRDRSDSEDLGDGFPKILANHLNEKYPEYNLTFLNRGISGDRVVDLKQRWSEDCLDLQPNLVTILVGINDVGHIINDRLIPTVSELKQFEENYRYLLKSIQEETDANIVLMEPFLLPYPEDRWTWRDQLDPRIQLVRRLAKEFDALLIPLDGLLNAKGIKDTFEKYTGDDGVHPTAIGHETIANIWLEYIDPS